MTTGARGLTLAELLVSMALMTIVLGGIASALVVASHALPGQCSPAAAALQMSDVADRIADDLAYAQSFTQRSSTAVQFVVPDRDGDTLPDTIRYAWSGTAGDPLTRQYKSGTAVTILEGVQQFNLAYDLRTESVVSAGAPQEGAEYLLSSYTGALDLRDYSIQWDNWIGQYFVPSLPPSAISWRVTRVKFWARASGLPVELTWVQLRTASSDRKPTSTVLEEVQMPELTLTLVYVLKEFSFANVSGLTPGQGLCLVLKHSGSGADSAGILYDDNQGPGLLYTGTGDRGANWTYDVGRSMQYYVYGRVVTPGPPQTTTRYYVTGVRVALAGKSAPRVETSIRVVNTPEVGGP